MRIVELDRRVYWNIWSFYNLKIAERLRKFQKKERKVRDYYCPIDNFSAYLQIKNCSRIQPIANK